MNKMTKKLFRYFTLLLIFFAVSAFLGFLGVFRYYTFRYREQELMARAETIKNQMEQFMEVSGPKQGKGAYLKFINDIAMADAYIVDTAGNPFSFGNNVTVGNLPTEEVKKFAMSVFASGSYEHFRKKDENNNTVFYAGMPIYANGNIAAAVIIHDDAGIDQYGFILVVPILGGCMLLAFILSAVLSVFLSKRFVLPIQRIAYTTKELTRGNYTVKTGIHDGTELGELAEETDMLAQKLETAREESKKLEQMQKDYISNISHELRTPVTVIRSSLEAICDGVVQGEKAEEYQHQMLEESIALQRLVNDMLELSRLQNKDFPIEKENMDLLMSLEDALRAVRVLAFDKEITISYVKNIGECQTVGDYDRLRQMFIAALDNAVKYSERGGQITVDVGKNADAVVISIQDNGCGIPAEELENIFARFYRGGQNREKGSGLGLAIIKSIAERHDIRVEIQSVWQEGTTIRFIV